MRILRRAALALVLLVGLAPVAFRLWVGALAPSLGGREAIPGLGDSVVVLWDSLAVPHVIARSDSDLFAAFGYLHARDRMWQMDLLRHVAEGRVSELFGARTLDVDQSLRGREISRLARAGAESVGAVSRAAGAAYARGVNAWLATGRRDVEFRLLGHTPEPWRLEQSVEIALLQAWELRTENGEIPYARAAQTLGETKAADLFVPYPDSAPVIVESSVRRGRVTWESSSGDSLATASNAWVFGPAHTRSGKPILANDPHLPLRAPSIWYLVGAHAPGYELVGVTIPGLPPVILGHTRHHGWGFTNGMIDDVDYVQERITTDSARYRTPSGWANVETVVETVHVKGRDPVTYRRYRTANGPLVDVGWRPDSETAFALRWTGQQPSDGLAALIGMARAPSREAFEAALTTFRTPEQNIVYADSLGTIAYNLAGFVPVRRSGDGSRPEPGWTAGGGWARVLTAAELPRVVNPSSGFIVTANNRIVGDAFPIPIRAEYDLPDRAERIWEMVRRDTAATAATVAREQVDEVSVFLRRIAPMAAKALEAGHPALAEQVRRWNGEMALDRTEPTLVWSWFRELQALTFDDESPDFRPTAPLRRWMLAGASPWFDDRRTPEPEDLPALARRAMDNVLARGAPRPWGALHSHTQEHALGAVPVLGRLTGFNVGPLRLGGGNQTVNVCPTSEFAPPYRCTWGPSMRHVVDFGDVDGAGGFILPTGQSGNPRSPHYRDQTAGWIRGDLWILPLDVRRVRATDTLVLVPAH
jgi:penicillin amidase